MSQGRPPARPDERDPAEMRKEWQAPDQTSLNGLENDRDWVYRFVNTSFQGNTEIMSDMHFSRVQEGFVNVRADDYPQNSAIQALKSADGHVRRPGQILMRMSRYTAESKARQLQERSARNLNREGKVGLAAAQQDSRMPIHLDTSRTSEVLFGGGK